MDKLKIIEKVLEVHGVRNKTKRKQISSSIVIELNLTALEEKQPFETFMGYTVGELKQIIHFAKTRGFCPEPEEKQESCTCRRLITENGGICPFCHKQVVIKPQPRQKIAPLPERFNELNDEGKRLLLTDRIVNLINVVNSWEE
jgi:hypothetical protein